MSPLLRYQRVLAAAAALVLLAGLAIAISSVLHIGGVIVEARRNAPNGSVTGIQYDFRLYSLLLLGALLAALGLITASAAPGLARGEGAAWRRALWATLALLAVTLPLIPIQVFGLAFALVGAVNLLGLVAARRSLIRA